MFEPEVIKKLLNPRNLESLKLSKVDLEAISKRLSRYRSRGLLSI